MSEPSSRNSHSENMWWIGLLTATAANCAFQIAWFWRFRAHNIVMDGIDYIGLARHLVDGNFKASLHGYWSPLFSWLIGAAALLTRNYTLLGRLVTIASFLLCLPLLYLLTWRLWRARVAAALAVFWFSTARGLISLAVGSIVADFVLTACVLVYFIVLLQALRHNRPVAWILLGAAHAVAFLAKAIAMPWLAIATIFAVLVQNARTPRCAASSMLLAFLLPALVWVGWGTALRSKYGVFTTGYQLRQNLIVNLRRRQSHHPRGDNLAFADTRSTYDDYMVGEVPWSTLQSFSFRNAELLPMILDSEVQNIPAALKESVILLSPGGALALTAMVVLLARKREDYRAEAAFAGIVLVSTASVIVAYCMLVLDGRYVIPFTPVLIAIGCPLLLPAGFALQTPRAPGGLRKTALGLWAASTLFLAVYSASPFRTVDRDFETSCYQVANVLRESRGATLVSLGNGPYPEHGVGFEVGPYVAYLAGWRMVGGNLDLPDTAGADELVSKALAERADAIAVWGSPALPAYHGIVEKIQRGMGSTSVSTISDPYKGEVGTLILSGR